jgi:hypothetical protein
MTARRARPGPATARLAGLISDVCLPHLPIRRGGVVVAADGAIIEALGLHGAIGDRVAIGGGVTAAGGGGDHRLSGWPRAVDGPGAAGWHHAGHAGAA